jgi:PAS domain S-box-containing protein
MNNKKNKKDDEIKRLKKHIKELEKSQADCKQAEEKIYKANRLYAVLSKVNQAVVREEDKQRLLQEICNIAIEYGKFKLAWIGFVDEETKLVKPVAYSGEDSDYLKNIKISITDELTGKGPTGRAIIERRSIVFNDLENNPDYKPWRKQALEKGYRSSAAFPIWLYNNVIGALNIYAVEPDFFDKHEIKLFKETALDISFVLEKFEEEHKRLEMEKELKMERNNLLNILESMKEGVYIIDQEYKLQYVNSYLQKGFVLFKEQKCFKYFYGQKKICPWCKNKDIIEGKTIRYERFSKKDGKTYDIIDTPLKNIDGSIFKLSILRDITDRKKGEEALRESEEQLQTLIDTMLDFVCFKDGDGRWLKVNDASLRIFQLEGIDYRGKKDSELAELNSKLRGSFLTCKETDARVWKEGSIFHEEEAIPDSNGSVRVFDVTKMPVSHSDGARKGIVIIGHDITERKQAEEELQKHKDHLEELVKERTSELENANKELKRFNKLFVGREFRIKELKDKVKELEKKLRRKKY